MKGSWLGVSLPSLPWPFPSACQSGQYSRKLSCLLQICRAPGESSPGEKPLGGCWQQVGHLSMRLLIWGSPGPAGQHVLGPSLSPLQGDPAQLPPPQHLLLWRSPAGLTFLQQACLPISLDLTEATGSGKLSPGLAGQSGRIGRVVHKQGEWVWMWTVPVSPQGLSDQAHLSVLQAATLQPHTVPGFLVLSWSLQQQCQLAPTRR